MRTCGILLPISSLPSPYGIGGFSKEAYDFVDFVQACGASGWQILPLGPTGYGDSPYQSFSTFAGNPYYIDLTRLIEEGLLTESECDGRMTAPDGSIIRDYGTDSRYVDYERIYLTRFKILRLAYSRSRHTLAPEYGAFIRDNSAWLDDYALFMALKDRFGGAGWADWDDDIRMREPEALERYKTELAGEIGFHKFLQYEFFTQWNALKQYANSKGIKIIGDVPIYVAFDSADAWSHPEMFLFDADCNPIEVAGCPPDAFSADGQLWGNPLYDWDYHRSTGYAWWLSRVSHCFKLYDTVRIDHFRGFDEFYAIPAGAETAAKGVWRKGPGIELFNRIKAALNNPPIIAEDLGFLTDSVRELLAESGYPGMKVLQFAFYPEETSVYLPHRYDSNCVVYTGTHDNDTTRSWYAHLETPERWFVNEYIGKIDPEWDHISWDFIRIAFESVADLAIIPMHDFLELGGEARINFPSTLGTNWKWRMLSSDFTEPLAARIHRLAWVTDRLNPEVEALRLAEEEKEEEDTLRDEQAPDSKEV